MASLLVPVLYPQHGATHLDSHKIMVISEKEQILGLFSNATWKIKSSKLEPLKREIK